MERQQPCCIMSPFLSADATPWTVQPSRLLCPWDSPGKNTGVGCHALLQGIFPTQGLNLCLTSPALAGEFFTTCATWEVQQQHARMTDSVTRLASLKGLGNVEMPLHSLGPREMGAHVLAPATPFVGRGAHRTWLATSNRVPKLSGGVVLYCTGDRGKGASYSGQTRSSL